MQSRKIGLGQLGARSAGERLRTTSEGRMWLDLQGLSLHTQADVDAFEAELRPHLLALPGKVRITVNYDRFSSDDPALPAWLELVERNRRDFFLESTRITSSALFRLPVSRSRNRRSADLHGCAMHI